MYRVPSVGAMCRVSLKWTVLFLPLLIVFQAGCATVPAGDVFSNLSPGQHETWKQFSAQTARQLLKEALQKKRMGLWEEVFGARAPGQGGGRQKREADWTEGQVLSAEDQDRMDTFIGEVMGCQDILGLSLGLAKGGVRQSAGYGVANIETALEVDRHTLFGIGSNTKAFTAATIAQLMVSLPPAQRFNFYTPLADILEDFKLADQTRTEQTTLMDVLSHRTGLGSADLGLFAGYPLNMTTEDMCRRLQFLPEMFSFRSMWTYSNTMLVLVSRVCEIAAGKTWSALVEETILRPLGMNNSFLARDGLTQDNTAMPYIKRMYADDMFVQQDPRLFDIPPLESAGAIMASAEDMTKWLQHLLEANAKSSRSVLRQLFTERMLLPPSWRSSAALESPEPILHLGYGMGFMTSYYKGHMVYWHTGDFHGYLSWVLLVPDWNIGIYLAVNSPSSVTTSKAVQNLVYFILELLEDGSPWVNLTLACPVTTPTSYPASHDDDPSQSPLNTQALLRPAEDYVGVYGHGLLGDITIVQEDKDKPLRMELGRLLVADLVPTSSEFIFKMAARPPVADTKDWEIKRSLIFKASRRPTPTPAMATGSEGKDSKNKTAAEEEETRPELDQIEIFWGLERYVFRKDVRFDTVLEEGEKAESSDGNEDGSVDLSGTVSCRGQKTTLTSVHLLFLMLLFSVAV